MKILKIFSVFFLALLSSCEKEDNPENESETLERDYAIVQTENPQWPIMANHANGEHIAIKVREGSNEVQGAAYLYEGLEVYLKLTPEGIPVSGIINDHLLIFENFEGNEVDLGIVTPEGETHVIRDIEIEENELSPTASIHRKAPGNQNLSNALKAGSLGVGIMGCALSAAFAVGTVGTGIPVALLSCGSALISAISLIQDWDSTLGNGATGFGLYANSIGCISPQGALSCIGFVLDVSGEIADSFEAQQNNLSAEYDITQAALLYGYGAIQITLKWDNTADLDLYVTDPVGETIYYGAPSSSSGGQLDIDDRDGIGPENIFWPVGTALTGNYSVEVNHYSGASPANFTVRVQVLDKIEIYTGTISANQTLSITSFNRRQILTKEGMKITQNRFPQNKKMLKK